MIQYRTQYNIAYGTFLTFLNDYEKPLLRVNHKKEKMEKIKKIFPYKKYQSFTKENFILMCVFVVYTYTPTSFEKMVEYLYNIDIDDFKKFKMILLDQMFYAKNDLETILNKNQLPLNLYIKNEITFIGMYVYILVKNKIDEYKKSRIKVNIIKRLTFIFKYVKIKDEIIELYKKRLINENTLV